MRNLGKINDVNSIPRHKDIITDHNQLLNRNNVNQHSASAIKYNNENTKFNADNMQDIIDELDFNDKIVSNAQGTLISITDSSERKLDNLKIRGKTTQDGIPSTANQIPLVSTGDSGEINLQICKKNLLDLSNAVNATTVVDSIDSDGTINIKGGLSAQWGNTYLGSVILISGEKYTISGTVGYGRIGLSKDEIYVPSSASEPSISFYSGVNIVNNSLSSLSFTAYETCMAYVWYCTDDNNTGTNESFSMQLMIESGEHATNYETSSVQTFTIQTPNGLCGIPVTSGGNYTDENGQQWICDEIDFERGVYVQRVKRIGASTGWSAWWSKVTHAASGTVRFYAPLSDKIIQTNAGLMCNAVPVVDWATMQKSVGYIGEYQNNIGITLAGVQNLTTSDEVNAYLNSIGCEVMYILATPIETPLPAEEIAAYEALYTNKPNTTIVNDSNAYMSVDYIVNNHTAEYVTKRFEELESNTDDGIIDVTEGVIGTLGVGNGGTGYTSITDTNYTTMRYRGSVLVPDEATADSLLVNGAVAWIYK